MHICNCENPVEVFRYGNRMFVPCGHCDMCRSIRNSAIADRLKYEIQQHKFGVFFTLTYADMFLPRVVYDNINKGFVVPDFVDTSVHDFDNGMFVSWPFLHRSTEEYVKRAMSLRGYIPVLRKKDAQDFLKRLRININRHFKNENIDKKTLQVTYALCGEYGPTTHRPHFHCVLLFDSDALAHCIHALIHKSWPFGSSKSRFLGQDESGQYVAKYVNSVHSLPSVLKCKAFRPFLLVSKSHPLGLYSLSEEEVKRIFNERSPTFFVKDTSKGVVRQLPLWRVCENWLFPRFTGYNHIDVGIRTRLLEFACKYGKFREFQNSLYGSEHYQIINPSPLQDNSYFDCSECIKIFAPSHRWLMSSMVHYFDLCFKGRSFTCTYRDICDNALKSLFYCAKRMVRNMHRFGVNSIEEHLRINDEYDFNKFLYQMELQAKLESSIMQHDPSILEYIDCEHFNPVVLDSFDIRPYLERIKLDIQHSHKNKAKHNYLALHPEYAILTEADDFREGFL